jgi:hypothetical protein
MKELDVQKLTRQLKIFHFEFLEQGLTVKKRSYLEILVMLREAVYRRRPELFLMLGYRIMTMPLLMTRSLSRNL